MKIVMEFFHQGNLLSIMSKSVLTRCEYVGMEPQYALNNFSDWKFIFTPVNRNEPSGSEKYGVANELRSLMKERMSVSHLQFVCGFNKAFFTPHFSCLKKVDGLFQNNVLMLAHMPLHSCHALQSCHLLPWWGWSHIPCHGTALPKGKYGIWYTNRPTLMCSYNKTTNFTCVISWF